MWSQDQALVWLALPPKLGRLDGTGYSLSIADEVDGFTGAYIASGCHECLSPDMNASEHGKWLLLGSWHLPPSECALLGATLLTQAGASKAQVRAAFEAIGRAQESLDSPPH